MNVRHILLVAVPILLLAVTGCARDKVFVGPDAVHARVVGNMIDTAERLYPVYILKVDGHPANHAVNWLAPGQRTFRVQADFSQMALNEPTRLPVGHMNATTDRVKELVATLEPGKEYKLMARYLGPTLRDWEPVLIEM